MKTDRGITQNIIYDLAQMLEPSEGARRTKVLRSAHFTRTKFDLSDGVTAKDKQVLVINPTKIELELNWERNGDSQLSWTASDRISPDKKHSSVLVPPRGWVLGVDRD